MSRSEEAWWPSVGRRVVTKEKKEEEGRDNNREGEGQVVKRGRGRRRNQEFA